MIFETFTFYVFLINIQAEDEKEIVRDIISDAVSDGIDFKEVLIKVKKHFQYDLEAREKYFIKREYVKYAISQFLADLYQKIDKIPVNLVEKWLKNRCFLDEILTFKHVKGSNVLHYCNVKEMLNKEDRKMLSSEMISMCEVHIENHVSTLQNTCKQFIVQFESYMKQKYINTGNRLFNFKQDVLEKRGIKTWLEEIKVASINEKLPAITSLIEDLKKEDKKSTTLLQFEKKMKKLLNGYKQKVTTKIEIANGKKLKIIQGVYANTAEIFPLLELHLQCQDIDEVRIIITKLMVINADLLNKGINLVIITDSIFVDSIQSGGKKFVIDTSGRNGDIIDKSKAEDGKTEGRFFYQENAPNTFIQRPQCLTDYVWTSYAN